jgi:hypothetical protein
MCVKKSDNIFRKEKREKKESHIKSRNDERERREERPTESEEWMLNLLDFFIFLFDQ